MKTKHYELTESEIAAIAFALDALWFGRDVGFKDIETRSPVVTEMKNHIKPLMEQFKRDHALI